MWSASIVLHPTMDGRSKSEISISLEAIAASTLNAAYSLGIHAERGSLEAGKSADLVILRSARLLDLIRVGVPAIRAVVKDGRVVVRDGRRTVS